MEEAREQLKIWLEVDLENYSDEDWAEIIISVPDEDKDNCLSGYAETEKFVEGKRGKKFYGSYYWECE